MPTEEQIAILKDVSQSIAFDDERHGEVVQLALDGYLTKDGDLYELTALGEKVLADHMAGLGPL